MTDHGDRGRYRKILERTDLAFAPLRPGCTWSMSVVDCLAMGIPVVAPRMAWQAEAIDDALLFSTTEEAVDVVRRLTGDRAFRDQAAVRAHASTAALDPQIVAGTYLEAIS